MLDESGVDCLELAVPFPGSVTDGPTVRASADRALAQGVDLDATLAFIARVRPSLRRLRIALLVDWSHSLKRRPLSTVADEVAAAGVDGLLVHGLPPRLRAEYYQATHALPIVTTCYHRVSSPEVLAEAAAKATAYVYLVAHYGRSGSAPAAGYAELAGTVARLRATASAPIAVGFGVRTRDDVEAIHRCGADAVIVGSAGVAVVESALARGRDVVADFGGFARSLRPSTITLSTGST
ncbi:tryptophan synthase, alpha chain [Actinokineospora alba]|uniref:tryptophan synthase n=2 Tax=Actinokineospora alba TaxID=504798 RepID=A0A1H0M7W8_9PSEU|nr:tryptophan synthase, alpha chain [Actinokineospora alba]SDO76549.1 tryptophan synthase, alpha chain [Actinokineospora alba]